MAAQLPPIQAPPPHPMPAGFVLTPGGYRHPDLVHHVPHGHKVRRRRHQLQIVHHSSRRIVARIDAPIPGLPNPGPGSSWRAVAQWQAASTISQLDTSITVPDDPAIDAGQTIFLFSGLQDGSLSILLQPVLQWGVSQAGGGSYWSLSNWYIDPSGHVLCKGNLPVATGTALTAIIALEQEAAGVCSYTVGFQGYPGIDLTVDNIDPCVVAVEVLESYQVDNPQEYPATAATSMSNIFIAAGGVAPPVTWQFSGNPTTSGESINLVNSSNPGGELQITY